MRLSLNNHSWNVQMIHDMPFFAKIGRKRPMEGMHEIILCNVITAGDHKYPLVSKLVGILNPWVCQP